jgi:class 3 adenylate cyclase/tetratricopeptide (TPR) repeat protein
LPPTQGRDATNGDRRHATVLFADISGYTALCAATDAEQIQALLNRFFALMDATIVAYGGRVIDHAGDGVLAVFGAPVAHGNDPERAMRAAFEMHAAAGQLTDASARPLELHIGIASGEVVAAVISGGVTPKFSVTGDTVNLAARVNALGGPGDTLVSQSAYAGVSALIDAQDLGEKTLKGFERPMRVYRASAFRAGATQRLPFVGRDTELKQLAGVLDSVRMSGRGASIAIRGDPGIGKSRLVEELRWRAQSYGFDCQIGRVLDFGVGKGQDALTAVVAAVLGLAGDAQATERSAAVERAIEQRRFAPNDEQFIRDLLSLPQREGQQQIFDSMDNAARTRGTADAVAALVSNAARERPRLIAFEDIHWGTPLLMACLASLTAATRRCPLLLALTTRVDGDPLDRHWRAASQGTALLTIDLGPLLIEDAHALAAGAIASSARFAAQCIERAEGNPLFLEQLLRNAKESESANLPPTIQSLVLSRIDRLSARDKAALQAASVIGKRFTPDLLRFLIADESYRCDALVAADLVRPEGSDFLFAHALIQEGVYSSLLNTRKRELHARAARWCGERDELVLKAEHLDRAQDPASADAYLDAAREEARRFHFDPALLLAQRGEALAQDDAQRHAFAMLRGDVLRQTARTAESIAAFEQALNAASDGQQRCRAWLGMAAGYRITGDQALATQALDAAQPVAKGLGLAVECSRIHSMRGNLYFAQGKVDACRAEHELALENARRAGDVECEALALSGLGDHAYAAGRMITGGGYFRRCVELCRQAGLVRLEIPNTCMVGHCMDWNAEGPGGMAEIRKALELSSRIGVPQTEVVALESLSFTLVNRGEFEEAEPWIEKAMAAAQRAGARRYYAVDLMLLAECRRSQRRADEARELIGQAYEISKQIGLGFLGPSLLVAMAATAPDATERRRLLAEGEAMCTRECLAHAHMMFRQEAINIALLERDWDEALRQADALDAFTAAEPLGAIKLATARARLLVALGRDGPSPDRLAELRGLRARILAAGLKPLLRGLDVLTVKSEG